MTMNVEKVGTMILVLATILVAASILLDGAAARIFNRAAGIAWFSGAGLLGLAAWRSSRPLWVWCAALGLTGLVAYVVKPVDFLAVVIGFGLAAMVIALAARPYPLLWAKLIVALYLPLHIGTAIASAVYRNAAGGEATIRTDPPPTAALVPIAMLVTAMTCGYAVQTLIGRKANQHQAFRRNLRHT